MKKEMKRKLFALISSYIVLFNSYCSFKNKSEHEIIFNDKYYCYSSIPFATYNDKNVYIGFLYNYKDSDNIYILDGRFLKDPNMKIINSYLITDVNDINNIIKIIEEYETRFPSRWDRTSKSMKNEWLVHNFCYYFNIETPRSGDVDLNNADENKFLILKK